MTEVFYIVKIELNILFKSRFLNLSSFVSSGVRGASEGRQFQKSSRFEIAILY